MDGVEGRRHYRSWGVHRPADLEVHLYSVRARGMPLRAAGEGHGAVLRTREDEVRENRERRADTGLDLGRLS